MKTIHALAGSAIAALSLLAANPIFAQDNSIAAPGNAATETEETASDAEASVVDEEVAGEGLAGEDLASQGAADEAASGATAGYSPVVPMPDALEEYRGQNGMLLTFEVTGDTTGPVWGNAVYSDDSDIATAAVHMGLLQPGETGLVTIEIIPGLDTYESNTFNGVTTSEYGEWGGSFRFLDARLLDALPVEAGEPDDLTAYRDQQGALMRFEVTGNANGAILGDRIYTDNSPVGTAAVHQGVLNDGETGIVTIEFLPGQTDYAGAERNGVVSNSNGEFGGSYRFLALGLDNGN